MFETHVVFTLFNNVMFEAWLESKCKNSFTTKCPTIG